MAFVGVCGLVFVWLASLRLIKSILWGCAVTVVSGLIVMISDWCWF